MIFILENAGESLYPNGWNKYLPVYSSDGIIWQKVDGSQYKNGKFEFIIQQPFKNFFVAWYQPYSYQKYRLWLDRIRNSSIVKAQSIDKKVEVLSLGSP